MSDIFIHPCKTNNCLSAPFDKCILKYAFINVNSLQIHIYHTFVLTYRRDKVGLFKKTPGTKSDPHYFYWLYRRPTHHAIMSNDSQKPMAAVEMNQTFGAEEEPSLETDSAPLSEDEVMATFSGLPTSPTNTGGAGVQTSIVAGI
jgi:hypothetical protein